MTAGLEPAVKVTNPPEMGRIPKISPPVFCDSWFQMMNEPEGAEAVAHLDLGRGAPYLSLRRMEHRRAARFSLVVIKPTSQSTCKLLYLPYLLGLCLIQL
jgi:hypothetical protein